MTSSGEVELGRDKGWTTYAGSSHEWLPTERCTLREPAFFEACIAALEDHDNDAGTWTDATSCIWPDRGIDLPWFTECHPSAPVCD